MARDRAADAGSFDVVDGFPPTHRGSVTDGEGPVASAARGCVLPG